MPKEINTRTQVFSPTEILNALCDFYKITGEPKVYWEIKGETMRGDTFAEYPLVQRFHGVRIESKEVMVG